MPTDQGWSIAGAGGRNIDELIRTGDWLGAARLARREAEAARSAAPLLAFVQQARQAGQAAVVADALLWAVQLPVCPEFGLCRQALVANYERGNMPEAVAASRIGLAAYPADPVLVAYGSLAACRLDPTAEAVAALRAALLAQPDQFGSFYVGYVKVMTQAGLRAEAIDDLGQAAARLEGAPTGRAALLSAKVMLADLLHEDGRTAQLIPLLFELIDAGLPHLQAEYEARLLTALLDGTAGKVDLSAFRDRIEAAMRCITDILAGRTVPAALRPSNAVLAALVANEFRYIDLGKVAFTGTEHGVSEQFVQIVRQGPQAVAEWLRASGAVQPWHADATFSDRGKDILDTVTARAKRVLSPFTGRVGTTTRMAGEECFVFSDAGQIALVTQWAETDVVFADTVYVLFDRHLVLYSGSIKLAPQSLGKKLFEILKGVVAHADAFVVLMNEECRAIGVAEFMCPHIGHYLWNCISGWEKFFSYGGGAGVDFYAVQQDCQTLGSVGALYPDEVKSPDRVLAINGQTSVQSIILDRHAMVLTIKNDHVAEGLARRVTQWAYDRTPPDRMDEIRRFRASCRLVALVTIRLDNRCWVNQRDGWPPLLRELTRRYPGIGFILDGINGDSVQGWTHAFMSAEAEQELAAHIIGECPGAAIYNSISCSVPESLVLADLADFFIAPVGAGMAKHRWIANLPGVAFSNRSFSAPNSRDGRLYDSYRDDAVAALHVPAEVISDVEEGRATGLRANFLLDWREILLPAITLCDSLSRPDGKA